MTRRANASPERTPSSGLGGCTAHEQGGEIEADEKAIQRGEVAAPGDPGKVGANAVMADRPRGCQRFIESEHAAWRDGHFHQAVTGWRPGELGLSLPELLLGLAFQ